MAATVRFEANEAEQMCETAVLPFEYGLKEVKERFSSMRILVNNVYGGTRGIDLVTLGQYT